MPRIRIIKEKPTFVLGEYRKTGEIINDPNPDECRNLILDGLAEALTPEEDAAEQEKEDAAAKVEAKKSEQTQA